MAQHVGRRQHTQQRGSCRPIGCTCPAHDNHVVHQRCASTTGLACSSAGASSRNSERVMPLTSLGSAYLEPARNNTHAGQACRALEGGHGHPALLGDLGAIKLRCCHAASASAGQQRTPAGTRTGEGGGGQSHRGEGRVVECCRVGEYGMGRVPVGSTALARLTELKGMPCGEHGNHLAHQQRSTQPRK